MKMFDRDVFFSVVREEVFGGSMDQEQVDGMSAILDIWEEEPLSDDLRWLAYPLATTKHETASTMQPIEEYGKGEGMSYGKPDPNTGECYYGRGFVQLTWSDNYKKADNELGFEGEDSCYLHPDNALDLRKAADIMFLGMAEGWFRSGQTLAKYFNDSTDDAYGAREIINGDKHYTPDWADGEKIGDIIAGYHKGFLQALLESSVEPLPDHEPILIGFTIRHPPGVIIEVDFEEADDVTG
jgi:putative chitinase